MEDKIFLNKVVEFYQLIYLNDMILLIDIDNIILFVGQKIQKLVDTPIGNLIGKNHLTALPLPQDNISNIVISIDKVIKTRARAEFLSINLNHDKEYMILHCIQKPIINLHTNNIVAISVESSPLDFAIDFYKLFMLANINHGIFEQINDNKIQHVDDFLTLREHEIAFSLVYCKTAEKIASLLSLLHNKTVSPKTIHNIIRQQLYPKFVVHNIEALLEKIYTLGYHKKIPASFLVNLHFDLSLI